MATASQIAANRSNARKSTGPTSADGKARSRLNGITHGLCSAQALLPGEDAQALAELHAAFHHEHQPVGPTELYLVEKLVQLYWRSRRIGRAEREIVTGMENLSLTSRGFGEAFLRTGAFTGLVRYETAIDRSFKSSLHELKALQQDRFELGSFAPSEVVSMEPPPAAEAEPTPAPAAEPPQPAEQTATSEKLASLRQHEPQAVQAPEIVAAVLETIPRGRPEIGRSTRADRQPAAQQAA
ncbi:MAG: hypothetical protein HYS04_15485 [Acidobacteria bacterium]|nr:hypothetical protein [Acidobacteriota bacterium]